MLGFLDGVAMDITKLIVLGSALQDNRVWEAQLSKMQVGPGDVAQQYANFLAVSVSQSKFRGPREQRAPGALVRRVYVTAWWNAC